MADNQKGILYLIPVPIDQNSRESILLEKYQKIVKDFLKGTESPTITDHFHSPQGVITFRSNRYVSH